MTYFIYSDYVNTEGFFPGMITYGFTDNDPSQGSS